MKLQRARTFLKQASLFIEDPENFENGLENEQKFKYVPSEIFNACQVVLANSSSISDFEKWSVMEQLVVSGFETKQFEKALEYLTILENKFTLKSSRVLLLKGLYLESQKKWEEANALYNSCLEQDETQIKIRKRIISILITTGKINEAIDALVEHVDIFEQDAESWSMLCTLYYKKSLFKQAAFCCEELILMRPLIHFHHSRLASIQVRMNQLDYALKHYCRAFELCDTNKEALEGIHQVTSLLLQKDARNDTFLQLKALSVEMLAKIV